MRTNIFDRLSFLSLFLIIVLLPIFCLPFTRISVETSKGLLLVVGLAISIIFWAAARFSDGKIVIPKSKILLAGFGIVLAFFISAIFSSASKISFFGVMLDIGSFYFIFSAFLLMLTSSIILKDSMRAKMVLFGALLSSAGVLIFQSFHLFFPQFLSLGVLSDKMSNLLGSWNALGIFAAFFIVISLFVIEFFSVSRIVKQILGFLILLSLFLVAAVNFLFTWILIGVFALFIFVYKISFSSVKKQAGENVHFPIISFTLIMISLLFFISGQFIGGFLPDKLKLSNAEVSPSFSATMLVTKEALKQNPILGFGPNRFGEVWAMYKPIDINKTVNGISFWDTPFDSGSGLLTTFASTTGSLGILAWVIFFILFIVAGMRSLFSSMKNNLNWEAGVFFVAALFFFISAFFYPIGMTMFLLAFSFVGIFIGLSASSRENGEISMSFSQDHRKSFFSVFLLLILMIVSAGLSFKYIERFASVSYFGKAIAASNITDAENAIVGAVSLYPNDLYLRTYSQVYLLKINSLVNKGSALSDTEKADLQKSFDNALNSMLLAVDYNQKNYLNFRLLGAVYDTAGVLGVPNAYDKSIEAYQKASLLNPLNPGIKLSIARSFLANEKIKEAKDYANQALNLKADFIDAIIFLSQIAKKEGNNESALLYAEQALSFFPQDKDLIQYVDSLKNTSSPSVPSSPVSSQENNQTQ